jgi:hypothetical protein
MWRSGGTLERQPVIITTMTKTAAQLAPIGSQRFIDLVALDYHRLVDERLRADPETVLRDARENLQRWLPIHEGSGAEFALLEWQQLLDTKTVPELIAIILEDSEEGQRLRSSTPFAGLLSLEESRALWKRHAEASLH